MFSSLLASSERTNSASRMDFIEKSALTKKILGRDTSNPEHGSFRSTRLVINRRNDPLTGEEAESGKRLARHEGDGEAKGKPRRFDGDRENNDSAAAR